MASLCQRKVSRACCTKASASLLSLAEDGALHLGVRYSRALHAPATAAAMARALADEAARLASAALDPDVAAWTPADFPEVELEQDELDDILASFGD